MDSGKWAEIPIHMHGCNEPRYSMGPNYLFHNIIQIHNIVMWTDNILHNIIQAECEEYST